jgi:hypothetical protein
LEEVQNKIKSTDRQNKNKNKEEHETIMCSNSLSGGAKIWGAKIRIG